MNILEEQERLAREFMNKSREMESEYGNRLLSLVSDKFVIIKTCKNKSFGENLIIDYEIKLPSFYSGLPSLNSMISDLVIFLHCDTGFKETSAISFTCHDHKSEGYLSVFDFDREKNKEIYFIQRTTEALRKELIRIATEEEVSVFSILCSGPADLVGDIIPDTDYPSFTMTAGIQLETMKREQEHGIISTLANTIDITEEVRDNPYYIIDYIINKVSKVLERLGKYEEGE